MKRDPRNQSLGLPLAAIIVTLALPAGAAAPTPAPHASAPPKATPARSAIPQATAKPKPAPQQAPPESAMQSVTFTNISGFDYVQAPRIDYNFHDGSYKIPERFKAVRSGTELTADTANGNSKTKLMHAAGHVILHQNQPLKSGGDVTKVTQEPSTLTCDKLDADGARKFYVATGDVHFTQANREGSSDTATLDDATHMLHMEGHVHLRDKDQMLDADIVDYNTQTGEAHISGKPALIRLPVETPSPGPPRTPAPKKRRLI
jgi:lipopolysaccharide assembly outer membrane protein LptD (OstA)